MVGAICFRSNVDDTALKQTIPADFMEVFLKQAAAVTIIQAAGRGMLGRMKLVERFGRDKIVTWSSRQALDFAVVKPTSAQQRTAADYVAIGLSEDEAAKAVALTAGRAPDKERPPKPSLVLENFPATRGLAQLIKFSEKARLLLPIIFLLFIPFS